MPGTIKVSVLELMDSSMSTSPATANKTSSLSLKVALGKNYYQTTGGEDLSLPVLSLRENLVFMLYNAEGTLIWQTEMKTSLVVEKGMWDDKFPVNNGAVVHLRLQFSLSDDERMRIQEMRNSAVKRKHEELLKGNHEGEKAGDVISYVAPENKTAAAPTGLLKQTDRDECNNQPSNPQMQDPEEHSEHVIAINQAEYKVESAIESNEGSATCGEDNFDEKSNLRSLSSTEATKESTSSGEAENPVHSPQKTKLLVSSNVRKMISTLESSIYQGHGQKPGTSITKMDYGGSVKRTISVGSNMKDMLSHTIRKSLSLNMLSDINSQESRKVLRPIHLRKQEQMLESDNGRYAGSTEAVMNSSLPLEPEVGENVEVPGSENQKGVKDGKNMSVELSSSAQSPPCKRTNAVQKQIKAEEEGNISRTGNKGGISVVSAFSESINSGKDSDVSQKEVYDSNGAPSETSPLSSNVETRVLNAIKHPSKGQKSVRFMGIAQNSSKGKSFTPDGVRTAPEIPGMPSYRKLDKTKDPDITVEKITSSNTLLQVIEDKNKSILPKNEYKDGRECQLSSRQVESVNVCHPFSLWTCQHESATETERGKFYCGCCIYRLNVQSDTQNSCESNEWLFQTEMFLFGTFGVWIPRHLCITTGSRDLRNLVDRCRICLGPLSTENNFPREINDEEKMLCNSSLQLTRTGNISHDLGKLDNKTFPGSLVGKIIIIIFACGTLLLRTK